jgi:hypothetical protein
MSCKAQSSELCAERLVFLQMAVQIGVVPLAHPRLLAREMLDYVVVQRGERGVDHRRTPVEHERIEHLVHRVDQLPVVCVEAWHAKREIRGPDCDGHGDLTARSTGK